MKLAQAPTKEKAKALPSTMSSLVYHGAGWRASEMRRRYDVFGAAAKEKALKVLISR